MYDLDASKSSWTSYCSVYDQANYLIFAEFTRKFFPQCKCSVNYNDLQSHIVGHYVHCSMEFMWSQLISYMHTCISGVKIVGENFLASKGLAIKDYISCISQEHNRGNELFLYLMSRMTQRHVCVIGKNSVWYTSCCKDKGQEITVADCQTILVYLGAGTVWDTKLIVAAAKNSLPKSNPKLPFSSGEEYSPPSTPVYDLAIKRCHTRSMGLVETESSKSSSSGLEPDGESSSSDVLDTEPASEPEVPKPKPKHHCGHPRKPHIIKEKVYKIWRGQYMTWRWCTLCRKQFVRWLELNRHTVEDHDYKFLCSRRTCKKSFTSKSTLDKHSITHNPPPPPTTTFHVFRVQQGIFPKVPNGKP